jgi:hypothetical protein
VRRWMSRMQPAMVRVPLEGAYWTMNRTP